MRVGLKEFKPRVVGITAFTCEIQGAAQVARFVKSTDDSILTVIGGIHASALPRETLQQYRALDVVVYGEGEKTLADVIRTAQMKGDFSAVQGVALRTSDGIRMTPPAPSSGTSMNSRFLIVPRLIYPSTCQARPPSTVCEPRLPALWPEGAARSTATTAQRAYGVVPFDTEARHTSFRRYWSVYANTGSVTSGSLMTF